MVNNKLINFFVIFSFIGLWSSVGSDPNNFLFIFEKNNIFDLNISKINLKELINFCRAAFPLFCLLISLFIIIKYKLFKNQKKFIYILLVIHLIQFVSTIFSNGTIISDYEDSIDHFGRYHWIISSMSLIFIFMISEKLNNFENKILFYISIFFITLMILWFSTTLLYDFFNLDIKTSIYNLNIYRESAYFLNHQMPRITGLSRSVLFLYVIIFYLIKGLDKKYIFFKYTLLSIMGSLIFLFQSKFALIGFLIVNFFFIFDFKEKLRGILVVSLLIIIQIALFYSVSNLRIIYNNFKEENYDSRIIYNSSINKDNVLLEQKNNIKKNKLSKKYKHLRDISDSSKTSFFDLFNHMVFSGRLTLWEKSFVYIIDRPILGYGSMSDRIILNLKQIKYNQMVHPISNAFFYSILSGGIFSLIFFSYFWINIRMKIFNILKFNKNQNNEIKLSSLLLFIIFLRCLVENSIMLFGVDFILLLNSMYLRTNK